MVSSVLKKVVQEYYVRAVKGRPVRDGAAMIHVDEVASRVAVFYERIRNIIDYQEEHLLRKRFINRVLARRLLLNPGPDMAQLVIKDIIRAGHLPNDSVPESRIGEVQVIVDRMAGIRKRLDPADPEFPELSKWLSKVTANSIEECLFSPAKEEMLAKAMFVTMKRNLAVQGEMARVPEADAHLFVAIQRALLRADRDQLNYRLLKFLFPEWEEVFGERYDDAAASIPPLKRRIEAIMDDPVGKSFFSLCNKYNTVFYVLGDIVEASGGYDEFMKTVEDEEKLTGTIESVYREKVRHSRKRLKRLAFLIILSFFISKIAIAILVEIPLELKLTGTFSVPNAIINIVVPPLLMFIITSSLKMPTRKDLDLVMREVKAALFESVPARYIVVIPKHKGAFITSTLDVAYALTFVLSFYILWRILSLAHFNLANAVIFAIFISLVAATGVKVSNLSRELTLNERKRTFVSFLLDLLTIPFITIGRWIIAGFSRFNVFILLFNVFIEIPLQAIVEFIEEFGGLIRSKKEEIN